MCESHLVHPLLFARHTPTIHLTVESRIGSCEGHRHRFVISFLPTIILYLFGASGLARKKTSFAGKSALHLRQLPKPQQLEAGPHHTLPYHLNLGHPTVASVLSLLLPLIAVGGLSASIFPCVCGLEDATSTASLTCHQSYTRNILIQIKSQILSSRGWISSERLHHVFPEPCGNGAASETRNLHALERSPTELATGCSGSPPTS